MGEGMWEWFSRVSFGISKDMSRSVSDDGIEKVVELLDARKHVCAALHYQHD